MLGVAGAMIFGAVGMKEAQTAADQEYEYKKNQAINDYISKQNDEQTNEAFSAASAAIWSANGNGIPWN